MTCWSTLDWPETAFEEISPKIGQWNRMGLRGPLVVEMGISRPATGFLNATPSGRIDQPAGHISPSGVYTANLCPIRYGDAVSHTRPRTTILYSEGTDC